MATNQVFLDSDTTPIVAPSNLTSGTPIKVGVGLFVVPVADIASGATGAVFTRGVFNLPKVGGGGLTFALGDKVFWNASGSTCTATTTDDYIGVAVAAATDAATTVRVRINGTVGENVDLDAVAAALSVTAAAAVTATDGGAGNSGKVIKLDSNGKLDGVVIESGAGLIKDTDGTLAANSDLNVPTQKAVKAYADTFLPKSGGQITGNITCAAGETFDGKDVSTLGTAAEGAAAAAAAAVTTTNVGAGDAGKLLKLDPAGKLAGRVVETDGTALDTAVANLAKIKSGTVTISAGNSAGTAAMGGATWDGKPVVVTVLSSAGALGAAVGYFEAAIAAGTLTVTSVDKDGAAQNCTAEVILSYITDGR